MHKKFILATLLCAGSASHVFGALPPLEQFKLTEDAEGVRFDLRFTAPADWSADMWRSNLYLDTDNNIDTGYRGKDGNWQLGADLLIQGNKLHFFGGGTQTDWGWMTGGELPASLETDALAIRLPHALYLLRRGAPFRYLYQLDNQPEKESYFPENPEQQAGSGSVSRPAALSPTAMEPTGSFDARPLPEPAARPEQHGIAANSAAGIAGLRNPERGFRLMTEIANLHEVTDPYQLTFRDWPGQFQQYPFVTLEQAYCWLLADADRPISETKLEAIRQDLLQFRRAGVKLLLRFAYERNHIDPFYGPNIDTILGHMEQLKPVIHEFQDVIFMLQSGFIGAYGEWHGAAEGLHNSVEAKQRYIEKLFEILPPDLMTHIRVPRYKREVLGTPELAQYERLNSRTGFDGTPKSRMGFDNDGFGAGPTEGNTWPEPPYYGNPGNPEHDQITTEAPWLPVDGEMFFMNAGGMVDGFWAAERLRLHHYTSLGIFQSNAAVEKPGDYYSVQSWEDTPVSAAELNGLRLPVSNDYFSAGTVPLFRYLRDHLGYRLELQETAYTAKAAPGGKFGLDLMLVNRGFAVPLRPRTVYLALVDESGDVFAYATDWNWRGWQPYRPGDATFAPLGHRLSHRMELPDYLPPGRYRVGLWLPDPSSTLRHDPRYAVRLANATTPFDETTGVNFLGEVEIAAGTAPAQCLGQWRREGSALAGTPQPAAEGAMWSVADGAAFNFAGRSAFTIRAVIVPEREQASGTIAARYEAGVAGQYNFGMKDGHLHLFREMLPYEVSGATELEAGKRHTVTALYDGRRLRLYVDGRLDGSLWTGPVRTIPDTIPLTIGGQRTDGAPNHLFEGAIESLEIFDQALVP